jgi:hypothetical protein
MDSHLRRIFSALFLPFLLTAVTFGQNAQISGLVHDSMGAVIPFASFTLENLETHEKRQTTSNKDGVYALPSLPPGHYDLTIEAAGFAKQLIHDLTMSVAGKTSLDITLQIGSATQDISVDANAAQLNTIDASVSTVIDRKFVENLPLNGRSFQSLLTLVPGVISVPSSGAGVSGQIAVNGMRSESNYFLIDGVSANTGVNNSSPGRGAGYSGSLPSSTALGTTQSLISIDALDEFRGITSTYSAENGRVPGGQFSFRTRSGTSDFHGSAYDYFRNDAMDANSYFNNRNKIARTKMRQNDFGGTLGGPIAIPGLLQRRDRSFFFYSYEGLRLTAPQEATTTYVPTPELIAEAPAVLRPILNAFPKPNAGSLPAAGKLASYTNSYSQPSVIDAHSLRLDHALSDTWHIFGRFAYTPSSTRARYSGDMAQVNDTAVNSKSLTLGSTNMFSSAMTNDLRFNLSWNDQISTSYMDTFGGASPLSITDLAGLSTKDWALFAYRPSVNAGFWLNPQNNRQKQYNVVDTLTYTLGRHSLKFGVDWRMIRTDATLPGFYESPFYITGAAYTGTAEQQLVNNTPGLFTLYRSNGNMAPVYKNLSLFVQDEWKTTNRLSISAGLRWDVNPAPRDANGNQPYTIDQITNLATTRIAPQGSDLWKTTYNNFAPRFGFAYQAHQNPGHETVFRGGAGLFYDASSVQASEGYWYGIGITGSLNMNYKAFPVDAATLQSTPLPSPTPSAGSTSQIFGFDPNLKLPYALQWNGSVDQSLGQNQTMTLSYVGSIGDRLLLARQLYPNLYGNPLFPTASALYLYATINGSSSNYNALQVQYRRSQWHGLQMLTGYTWSHAIDDSTSNFTLTSLLRGNSNYDIRHNFQAAITYNLPSQYDNAAVRAALGGWALDSRISARSGVPVDVVASTQISSSGASYSPHPDRVTGQPLYVDVPGAPGGRRININAFSIPASGTEGNAGRNIARGFASYQWDFAFRRDFRLTERIHTNFRAEAFNLLNHANFGAINSNIQTNTTAQPFGQASGTQAGQLGGLNALYQTGGPRSLQLALKVQF